MRHLAKPLRNLLVVLLETVEEVSQNIMVVLVDERDGSAGVSAPPRTTDAMHIIVNVRGQVEVDLQV